MIGVGSCIATGLFSPTAEQMSQPPGLSPKGRQPANTRLLFGKEHLRQGLMLLPELCSPGGLVRSWLTCQGFCILHKFKMSQPGHAGGAARRVQGQGGAGREGIHLILGSIWPSVENAGTPRDFVHFCAPSSNRHISNLLLVSTSKRKEDPLMPNFSLQSKFRSKLPLRAPESCAVAGDADGSASPAAITNTEESRER